MAVRMLENFFAIKKSSYEHSPCVGENPCGHGVRKPFVQAPSKLRLFSRQRFFIRLYLDGHQPYPVQGYF
jgi:hypothetical protein